MKQRDIVHACGVCLLASNAPELCVSGTVLLMIAASMHSDVVERGAWGRGRIVLDRKRNKCRSGYAFYLFAANGFGCGFFPY